MPLKRDEAFWKEGMDEKRFALCCIHKIWICRQLWLALFLLRGFILVCGS